MKEALIITSLMCEAAPLIKAWDLRPVRENDLGGRFQLFESNGVHLGISGIGKLRSAVATSALGASILRGSNSLIIANIGIAGGHPTHAPVGTLVMVHKVRDVATNTRYYPDILLKHPARELPLDTHDHPVTTPLTTPTLVDMEASGFMQAATTLCAPSHIAVLKVVSDYCDGSRITPNVASELIQNQIETIDSILTGLRAELPDAPHLTSDESSLIETVASHAKLSLSQRLELHRRARALKAQREPFITPLRDILSLSISTKDERKIAYDKLLRELTGDTLL